MAWFDVVTEQKANKDYSAVIPYGTDGVLINASVTFDHMKITGSDTALVIRKPCSLGHAHIKHAGADSVLMQSSGIKADSIYVDHPKAIVPYRMRHPDAVQFVPPLDDPRGAIEDCYIGVLIIEAPELPEEGFRGVQGLTGFDCPVVRLHVGRLLIITDVDEHGLSFAMAVNCIFGGDEPSYIRSYSGRYRPGVVFRDRKGNIGRSVDNQLINFTYILIDSEENSFMSSDKQLIALKDKKIYDARKELDISKRMRGIDNNNPGNIRVGNNQWLGLVTDPDLFLPNQKGEREFCVFYHPKYGVRAMVILLLNYQRKYRLKTIEQLIQRYAPGNENNTVEYIRSVSADSGIGAKEEIAIADYYTARRIIVAMIKHENGVQPYPDEVIEVGLGMAGLSTPGEIAPNEVKVVKTENVAAGVAAVGTTAAGALEAVKTMYVENQAAISGITSQLSGLSTVSYIQLGLGVAILGALLYLILRRKDASFLRIR